MIPTALTKGFLFADNLLNESEVLAWLRANRYKKVEVTMIMYAVGSAALAFLLYSAFIVYGLKTSVGEPDLNKEE